MFWYVDGEIFVLIFITGFLSKCASVYVHAYWNT